MADIFTITLPNGQTHELRDNRLDNYGVCNTSSSIVQKDVIIENKNFSLKKGEQVIINFSVVNSAANPTLKVNDTDAKPIYYKGAAVPTTYIKANSTYELVYNGSQYEIIGDIDTTYIAASVNPKMDGTVAVGTSTKYAREDHVHPTDTSRVPTSRTINGKALSANITLSASDIGALSSDIQIPSKTSDLINDSNFVVDNNYIHTDNNYTTEEKNKLNNITPGENNQNAFSNIKIGNTIISANKEKDILELETDSNVILAPDTTNNKLTITNNSIPLNLKGAVNGVAQLDSNGLIPSSQLPDYTNNILEYNTKFNFPATGQTGKIYIDISTNLIYRWSGNIYIEIGSSLALGTTSGTAFRGDYGNIAYQHAIDTGKTTTATATGLYKIASTAKGHIANLTAVTKEDITALDIPSSKYNNQIFRGLTGGIRYIHFDFLNNLITVPSNIGIKINNYFITTSQDTTYQMPEEDVFYFILNSENNTFSITTDSYDEDKNILLAFCNKSVNFVNAPNILYVITTNPNAHYNFNPSIAIYGDSIAAGFGSLSLENMISANHGIRIKNFAIGSTGYLKTVDVGSSHLAGDGTVAKGVWQDINYAENNVLAKIQNETLADTIICMWAGTNDVTSKYSNDDIVNAAKTAAITIMEQGKIPVIISPVRRNDSQTAISQLTLLVNSMKQMCEEIGITYIDCYNVGINPAYTGDTYFMDDQVHPNNAGMTILTNRIAEGLKSICTSVEKTSKLV